MDFSSLSQALRNLQVRLYRSRAISFLISFRGLSLFRRPSLVFLSLVLLSGCFAVTVGKLYAQSSVFIPIYTDWTFLQTDIDPYAYDTPPAGQKCLYALTYSSTSTTQALYNSVYSTGEFGNVGSIYTGVCKPSPITGQNPTDNVYSQWQAVNGHAPPDGQYVYAIGTCDAATCSTPYTIVNYTTFEVAGGLPVAAESRTHIVQANPINGATVATSTTGTVGSTVLINSQDWIAANGPQWRIVYSLLRPDFNDPAAVTQAPIYTYVSKIGVTATSTNYYSTGQPILFGIVGRYKMTIQLQKPNHSFLTQIFGQGWQTVDSTTTVFTLATTTPGQRASEQVISANVARCTEATSSAFTLNECLSFGIAECLSTLVVPCGQSFTQFDDLSITNKPPLGYWGAVSSVLSTTTSTSTASGVPISFFAIAGYEASWFDPILTPIGDIIMLLLAIGIFYRLSKFDWQI